jgi:hypothetical protein
MMVSGRRDVKTGHSWQTSTPDTADTKSLKPLHSRDTTRTPVQTPSDIVCLIDTLSDTRII